MAWNDILNCIQFAALIPRKRKLFHKYRAQHCMDQAKFSPRLAEFYHYELSSMMIALELYDKKLGSKSHQDQIKEIFEHLRYIDIGYGEGGG